MAKIKTRVVPMPKPQPEKAGSKDKQERLVAEVKRLQRIYAKVDKKNKALLEGLIRRAAYMRVTLEDYEEDLDAGGYVEMFTQSPDTAPYERTRPVAQLYNSMNKNYQSIMKQLGDIVPAPPAEELKDKDDDFDKLMKMRGDR